MFAHAAVINEHGSATCYTSFRGGAAFDVEALARRARDKACVALARLGIGPVTPTDEELAAFRGVEQICGHGLAWAVCNETDDVFIDSDGHPAGKVFADTYALGGVKNAITLLTRAAFEVADGVWVVQPTVGAARGGYTDYPRDGRLSLVALEAGEVLAFGQYGRESLADLRLTRTRLVRRLDDLSDELGFAAPGDRTRLLGELVHPVEARMCNRRLGELEARLIGVWAHRPTKWLIERHLAGDNYDLEDAQTLLEKYEATGPYSPETIEKMNGALHYEAHARAMAAQYPRHQALAHLPATEPAGT